MMNFAFVPSDLNDQTGQDTPRFTPYPSTTHSINRGRYITSNDPRGYVPVYEYSLNNQWIMMDSDDGYVLWTSICKALGKTKADIVKMLESQQDLAPKLRRVKGGFLKIQGTWIPHDAAEILARKIAWPIRDDLVPIFGPDFPSTCLSPDDPAYGQIALPRRGRRRPSQPTGSSPSTSASTQSSPKRFVTTIPYSPSLSDARQGHSPVSQFGAREGLNMQQTNVISHTPPAYQPLQSTGTTQHTYQYYPTQSTGSPSPSNHPASSDQPAYRQHQPDLGQYNTSNYPYTPHHGQSYPYHPTSQTSSPSLGDNHTPTSELRNPYQDPRAVAGEHQPSASSATPYQQYNQYNAAAYQQERQPANYYYPPPSNQAPQMSTMYQDYQSSPYPSQQGFPIYSGSPGTGSFVYSAERDQGEGLRRRGSGYEDYTGYGRGEGQSHSEQFGPGQGPEAPPTGYQSGYNQGGYQRQPQQQGLGSQSPRQGGASPTSETQYHGQHQSYNRDQQYDYRRS